MTREEYDALDAVNFSTLKEIAKSPKHYQYRLRNPLPDNPRFAFGRAVHSAILTPDRFDEEFVVYDGVRRGKAWEAFEAASSGRTILKESDLRLVLGARDAVFAHPEAAVLLRGCHTETQIVSHDGDTGISTKGTIDAWKLQPGHQEHGILIDLKTTQDASPRAFATSVAKYHYHAQMAFYRDLLIEYRVQCNPFLIAVESEPPHDVMVYEIDDDVLYQGELLIASWLSQVVACAEANIWPGRETGIRRLELPAWAFADEGEE